MGKSTIRVADDVNDRLKALAAAPGESRSVTQLVDAVLRRHVGLVAEQPQTANLLGPSEVTRGLDGSSEIGSPARARASVGRPRARGARARADSQAEAKCTHPVGRRIGKQCAACGATVGG